MHRRIIINIFGAAPKKCIRGEIEIVNDILILIRSDIDTGMCHKQLSFCLFLIEFFKNLMRFTF